MSLEIKRFDFGDFLLLVKEKVLRRDGKPFAITPKAFELLLILDEKYRHPVEKDDLTNRVGNDG